MMTQEEMLRSLMNVRPPKTIREEFLKIQDEYLKERNRERSITDIADLEPVETDPRLYIWQGDITSLKCDAIVNACNSQMLGCFSPMHACIDNFIHTYAGVELRLKMHEIMSMQGHEEETGKDDIFKSTFGGIKFMKNKRMIIGLMIGVIMAILWSVVFVNVLNSMAGIGIGICLGISFGISGSLIFAKKDK